MAELRASGLALPQLAPGVRWSIMLRDAATDRVLGEWDPGAVLRTASVGKVFLLLEAARAMAAGEADPDEQLSWLGEELVEDSGLWHRLRTRSLPLVDLCVLTASVSDNLATNVLVRRFGVDAVRATAGRLGVKRSGLLDRVRSERLPGMPETLSLGCADELSDVMGRLHRREAISAAVSERVVAWLEGNVDLSGVPSGLGLDALAHAGEDAGELRIFNKTGWISVVQADVGVIAGRAGAVAYAVLAEWPDGPDRHRDVQVTMAEIGRRILTLVG